MKMSFFRRLTLTTAAVLLIATQTTSASPSFKEAYAAHVRGETQEAAQLYDEIIATGQADKNVYYNAALAKNEIGQPGYARLYLERARKLAPQDSAIRQALAQTVAQFPSPSARNEVPAPGLSEALVAPFATWLFEGILLLISFLLAVFLALRPPRGTKTRFAFFVLAPFAIPLAGFATFGLLQRNHFFESDPLGVVVVNQAKLLRAPLPGAITTDELSEGSILKLGPREQEFQQVVLKTQDEKAATSGWLRRDQVLPIREAND